MGEYRQQHFITQSKIRFTIRNNQSQLVNNNINTKLTANAFIPNTNFCKISSYTIHKMLSIGEAWQVHRTYNKSHNRSLPITSSSHNLVTFCQLFLPKTSNIIKDHSLTKWTFRVVRMPCHIWAHIGSAIVVQILHIKTQSLSHFQSSVSHNEVSL